jgi:hypothetical protein
MPLDPVVMFVLTLRTVARAGRLVEAIVTSPVWLIGHVAWAAGEARGLARLLIGRRGTSAQV